MKKLDTLKTILNAIVDTLKAGNLETFDLSITDNSTVSVSVRTKTLCTVKVVVSNYDEVCVYVTRFASNEYYAKKNMICSTDDIATGMVSAFVCDFFNIENTQIITFEVRRDLTFEIGSDSSAHLKSVLGGALGHLDLPFIEVHDLELRLGSYVMHIKCEPKDVNAVTSFINKHFEVM